MTNLIATPTDLFLPLSSVGSYPHFKIGGAGLGTPQLQYDYIDITFPAVLSDAVVDHPTTLTVLWNTTTSPDLLQLNGGPWRIATNVPEPDGMYLLGVGVFGAFGVPRIQRLAMHLFCRPPCEKRLIDK